MSLYNPNIPQPGDRPSDSQTQILQNFQTLDTVFTVDHVAFSLGINPGKHKQVTFDTVHPAGAPAGTESVLYTKNVGGVPELFWRNSVAEKPISPGAGSLFAWCVWNGGLAGANPPINGFNVANVNRTGVGAYTINLTNPMVSGLAGAILVQGGGSHVGTENVASGPGFVSVQFRGSFSGTPLDVATGNFMILGS